MEFRGSGATARKTHHKSTTCGPKHPKSMKIIFLPKCHILHGPWLNSFSAPCQWIDLKLTEIIDNTIISDISQAHLNWIWGSGAMIEKPSKKLENVGTPSGWNSPPTTNRITLEQGDSANTSSMSNIQTPMPNGIPRQRSDSTKNTPRIDHPRAQTTKIHQIRFSSKMTHFAWTLPLEFLRPLPMDWSETHGTIK